MGHSGGTEVLPPIPEHARVDLQVAQNRIGIPPERGKVPDVVIAHSTGLTQLHHRFVVLVHQSHVRVVEEVDELGEGGEEVFLLLVLLEDLVVELDPVGAEDGVAHLVPDALLLGVGDQGVLYLVPVCGENPLWWMSDEGKLEVVSIVGDSLICNGLIYTVACT